MTRRYWPLILTLASAWGASYLFIKVGVEGGFSPGALMAARALLAGVVLLGYLVVTFGAATAGLRLREAWRESLVLGLLNAALPFWLVAWGEKHIDSGPAGIAQATVPIFSLLIGLRFLPHERIGRARIFGVCLGLVGVAFVAGVAPAGDAWAVAGTLAVVLASVFYASAGIYGQLHLRGTVSGPVLATGSMLAGGVILLPLAIAQPPSSMPTAGALGSLLLLSLAGTVMAQLILFRVIALFGARRLSLVTYLMPGLALVYGALVLDEQITAASLIGLALILLGVALGSGTIRLRRRHALAAATRRASSGRTGATPGRALPSARRSAPDRRQRRTGARRRSRRPRRRSLTNRPSHAPHGPRPLGSPPRRRRRAAVTPPSASSGGGQRPG